MVSDLPPTSSPIQLGTEGKFGERRLRRRRAHHLRVRARRLERVAPSHDERRQRMAVRRAGRAGDLDAGQEARRAARGASALRVGQAYSIDGTRFTVASLTRARYAASKASCPSSPGTGARRCSPTSMARADEPRLRHDRLLRRRAGRVRGRVRGPRAARGPQPQTLRGLVSAPAVASLSCPQCGAAIELRTLDQAQSVVCASCGSILDARDPNLAPHPGVPGAPEVHAADPARHARHAEGREVGGGRLSGALRHDRRHLVLLGGVPPLQSVQGIPLPHAVRRALERRAGPEGRTVRADRADASRSSPCTARRSSTSRPRTPRRRSCSASSRGRCGSATGR